MKLKFTDNDMFGFCFKILNFSLISHPNPYTPSPSEKKKKTSGSNRDGRMRVGHELITVEIQ